LVGTVVETQSTKRRLHKSQYKPYYLHPAAVVCVPMYAFSLVSSAAIGPVV